MSYSFKWNGDAYIPPCLSLLNVAKWLHHVMLFINGGFVLIVLIGIWLSLILATWSYKHNILVIQSGYVAHHLTCLAAWPWQLQKNGLLHVNSPHHPPPTHFSALAPLHLYTYTLLRLRKAPHTILHPPSWPANLPNSDMPNSWFKLLSVLAVT